MESKTIVATEKLALELAAVYVANLYGVRASQRQQPYRIEERQDVWVANGQLPSRILGGTFQIHLAKLDGRVVKITHSK